MGDPTGCVGRSNVWGLGEYTPQKCPNWGFFDPFWPTRRRETQLVVFGGKTHLKSAPIWGFFDPFWPMKDGRPNWWCWEIQCVGFGGENTPKVPNFGVFGPILANGKKGDPTGGVWGENTPQKCPNLGFLDPFWPMKDGRPNWWCWEIQCVGFGWKTHPKSAQFWGFLTHFGQ